MKKALCLLLLALVLGVGFARAEGALSGMDDLRGKRIGVSTGSIQALQVEEYFPEAERLYFSTDVDMLNALRANRIDAFASAEILVRVMMMENPDLTYLDGRIGDTTLVGAVFAKTESGEALRDQFSAFIREIRQNGVYDEIQDIWFGTDEARRVVPDLGSLPAANGTLRMAVDASIVPFVYMKDGRPVGIEIDTAVRFCQAYGYGLEVVPMDFAGIIPAVVTGKVDFGSSGIAYTAERAESVLFAEPTYESGSVLAVLKADAAGGVRWQDYNGKRIGVLTGTLMEGIAREYFPDSEHLLFNSYPDCITALLAGRIDAYLGDEPGLKSTRAEQPEIDYIPDRITQNEYSFAFRKNDPASAALCAELNAFLARCHADGTMQELDDIWFGVDEDRKVVDMSDLTGENGTIRVVTTSTDMPFSYIKDGKNVGYDIDLVVRFCRDRGYALELGDVDFAGRIPAIESGKYDFTTDMNVTPERQEQVLFSDPTSYGGVVLAVLSRDLAPDSGSRDAPVEEAPARTFWDDIGDSFRKTFLRESRYKLFLSGVGSTLLITCLSILCGTCLGFVIFMLCRRGNIFANCAARFCMWLVQGMPMVVLLMILYYIIFGSVAISGLAVAVIGFTLTFGASVFGLLKMGVGAVDNGQYEAAYALGYSNRRTFFRIILPQALPHVMSAYKGEIVGLLKATAIVGYIAVQDLTKMGDIVRSRTYEAFFPLISVTVIYFILEGLLGFLIGLLQRRIDPKRRGRDSILKGIRPARADIR